MSKTYCVFVCFLVFNVIHMAMNNTSFEYPRRGNLINKSFIVACVKESFHYTCRVNLYGVMFGLS